MANGARLAYFTFLGSIFVLSIASSSSAMNFTDLILRLLVLAISLALPFGLSCYALTSEEAWGSDYLELGPLFLSSSLSLFSYVCVSQACATVAHIKTKANFDEQNLLREVWKLIDPHKKVRKNDSTFLKPVPPSPTLVAKKMNSFALRFRESTDKKDLGMEESGTTTSIERNHGPKSVDTVCEYCLLNTKSVCSNTEHGTYGLTMTRNLECSLRAICSIPMNQAQKECSNTLKEIRTLRTSA